MSPRREGQAGAKPGMRLRRPGSRIPEEAVQALEAEAERLASKAPGTGTSRKEGGHDDKPLQAAQSGEGDQRATGPRKVQITAYLPADVRDELRRAAVALSGPPHHETVTSIVERAIRSELERLRHEHGEFPETHARPRPGRRAGV